MSNANECPSAEVLAQLLRGEVSAQDQAALSGHLDGCERCQEVVEGMASDAAAWSATARHLARQAPPDSGEHRVVEQLQARSAGESTAGEAAPGGDEVLSFLEPPGAPGQLGRLGHYEVLEVVGRGGFGVVFKAFDSRLHRVVAIKVLAPQLATSAAARRRFAREARAAAAVRNDHVVGIHFVEETGPLPYLVMEYVAGKSLQERIDRTGPLQLAEVLRIGMQTARGLEAAHAHGLVHRDVKPANILLENGVERVKLTDFGLARLADDASLTQSGVVTGTPQYMAPEQARGEGVDHRADLFSLGSVLYAMCTGRPPFRAGTTMAVLRLVSDTRPRPVREVNPEVPERLAMIIDRLHSGEAARRFQSAAEVAEALEAHLADVQRPGGPAPAVRRPGRRSHRRWVLAAAILVLLAAGLGAGEATGLTQVVPTIIRIVRGDGTLVVEVEGPQTQVTVEGESGEVIVHAEGMQEIRLRPGHYRVKACGVGRPVASADEITILRGGKTIVRVRHEDVEAPPAAAPQPMAVTVAPEPLPAFPAGAPLNGLALVSEPPALPGVRSWTIETAHHRAAVEDAAYRPDGRLLATADSGGVIRLWDANTRRLVRLLVTPASPDRFLSSLSWSPDGRYLVVANRASNVRVWDPAAGRLVRTLHCPDTIATVAWSPNGTTIAGTGWHTHIYLWEAASGNLREVLHGNTGNVRSLAWSRDGRLASGSADKAVRVWRPGTPEPLQTLFGHTEQIRAVAWSPDGTSLASAGDDHTVRVWDTATGGQRHILTGHTGHVYCAAFSPDGKRLASGDTDTSVCLWDPMAGTRVQTLRGHQHHVNAVKWSPDGRTLVSASSDTRVRLWPVGGDGGDLLPADNAWASNYPSWSPDGKYLATGAHTAAHCARIWEASTGRLVRSLPLEAGIAGAWSPDSKTLATAGWDGRVWLWDVARGEVRLRVQGSDKWVRVLAFSPDGKTLAAGGKDQVVRLWDVATGRPLVTFSGHRAGPEGVTTLAWSPDSEHLISSGTDDQVIVWRAKDGAMRASWAHGSGPVRIVAWSPDGKTVVAGGDDGLVRVWEWKPGTTKYRHILTGHTRRVLAAAFSRDGTVLATGGDWAEVRLWEVATGRLLRVLDGPTVPVRAIGWSPDGRSLVGGGELPTTFVWNVADGRRRAVLHGLPEDRGLAVSAGGHFRCTAGVEDDLIYVVQTDKGQETLSPREFARRCGWKNEPDQVRPALP
jgi:WD40 repeat protein